jgi:hypothetical protein
VSDFWDRQDYELKFQVSDIVLLRKKIPILAHACTLGEIFSGKPPDPPSELPGDREGFLIRSAPGHAAEGAIERNGSYLAYTMAAYEHCFIDLSGSFSDYQAKFSAKTRGTIIRKIKKFTVHCNGRMNFQCYSRPEDMLAFYRWARQVSVLTYQERLLDAGLPAEQVFVEAMHGEAKEGRVRAYLLFDGEKPVAYLYCPVVEKTLVYAFLGFDPSYGDWSVGTILLWSSLERIFSEKAFSYFDFTEGSSAQKQMFSTHRAPCFNRLFLRDTGRNRLLLAGHRKFDRTSGRLGAALDRWGFKPAIKRLLRGT